MNETFIKNKGITQTFIQDNNHKHINKSSWDAEYDGNAANISVDLNDNGHKKHYDIQLDNDDLANILNIKGVDTDLDKRLINDYKKKIKKEYQQLLIEEKNKLLLKVAEGENLDINDLKKKYLKAKEITITYEMNKQLINEEELLDKIIIEDTVYYYENKEKGKVFDIENKEVGIFKNGSMIFF